jgi:hypothetical protein
LLVGTSKKLERQRKDNERLQKQLRQAQERKEPDQSQFEQQWQMVWGSLQRAHEIQRRQAMMQSSQQAIEVLQRMRAQLEPQPGPEVDSPSLIDRLLYRFD